MYKETHTKVCVDLLDKMIIVCLLSLFLGVTVYAQECDYAIFSFEPTQKDCLINKFISSDLLEYQQDVTSTSCVNTLNFFGTIPGISFHSPSDKSLVSLKPWSHGAFAYVSSVAFQKRFTIEFWTSIDILSETVLGRSMTLFSIANSNGIFFDIYIVFIQEINMVTIRMISGFSEVNIVHPIAEDVIVGEYTSFPTGKKKVYIAVTCTEFGTIDSYVGWKDEEGGDFLSTINTLSGSFIVSSSTFSSTIQSQQQHSPIRIGSGYASSSDYFKGDIHTIKVWDRLFIRSEITDQFNLTFPSSLPVVRTFSLTINQNETSSMLKTFILENVFDSDNSTVLGIRLLSLPSKGNLSYNGSYIETVPFIFYPEDSGDLSYAQTDPYGYSIQQGMTCGEGTSYEQMVFEAFDSGGPSPLTGTIFLCILDLPDEANNEETLFLSAAPRRSKKLISLLPSDPDDFRIPVSPYASRLGFDSYSTYSKIQFGNVKGLQGSLYKTNEFGSCNTTVTTRVRTCDEISPPYSFCYVSNTASNVSVEETFYYRFLDFVNTSNWFHFKFNTTNSLQLCIEPGSCTFTGNEYPARINATMVVVDYFGGREITYEILTYPENGELRWNATNETLGSEDYNKTSDPLMEYTPKLYYYNRIGENTFVEQDGITFINGNPCNETEGDCPEIIQFRAIAGLDTSDIGEIKIYVQETFSNISLIQPTVPEAFLINDTTNVIRFNGEVGGYGIFSIGVDPDNDRYLVGISITTTNGLLASEIKTEEKKLKRLFIDKSCFLNFENDGSSELLFYGPPSVINYILSKLKLTLGMDDTGTDGQITFRVFKPSPNGVTDFLFQSGQPVHEEIIPFNSPVRSFSLAGAFDFFLLILSLIGAIFACCCMTACCYGVSVIRNGINTGLGFINNIYQRIKRVYIWLCRRPKSGDPYEIAKRIYKTLKKRAKQEKNPEGKNDDTKEILLGKKGIDGTSTTWQRRKITPYEDEDP